MGKPGFENQENFIFEKTSGLFWTTRGQLQGKQRIVTSTYTPQKRNVSD